MRYGDDDTVAGAAALVVILAVTIGRGAWKKPNAGARLAALLGLTIALFLLLAVASPSGAGKVVVDSATGITNLFKGIGDIIGTF